MRQKSSRCIGGVIDYPNTEIDDLTIQPTHFLAL